MELQILYIPQKFSGRNQLSQFDTISFKYLEVKLRSKASNDISPNYETSPVFLNDYSR
ncbi:unnamed protein product [Schistosoma curassoni]|uniref:Uncharacterized protein n=1 Tax=Schistosoma curassoni TaxID=6186 RepID=A0A183KQ27_9TREM|nr:unnamed protein product [Schistosoma curassoni]